VNAAKRYLWSVSALGVLLLCAAGIACAQDIEPLPAPSKWNVKVGAFFPTQGNLKDQTSNAWLSLAADYYPNLRYRPLNGDIYLSAGIAFRDAQGSGAFILPIIGKIVWPITPAGSRLRVYGGLGGGVYFINTPFIGGTTQAGAKFILGVDLKDRYFLELNYDYVSGFSDNLGNGLRVDGISLFLGYKF
jgi:hypothetical protein